MTKSAFAIGAHPDDIEFMMSGTLLLLKRAGYDIHLMTLANGSCGTDKLDADTIRKIRRQETIDAAEFAGAVLHESLVDDLDIYYEKETVKRLGAIVREVAPEIVLTHSIWEYMEDHSNTCRLVQTAAFTRGMRNFIVEPERPPVAQPVTLYHALPYGLRDPLRRRARAGMFCDVTSVMKDKWEMLARHKSQKEWLDVSQGVDSYLIAMESMCKEIGIASGRYEFAEGWTRHLPLGYCAEDADPLLEALPERVFVDEAFESEIR